MDKVEIIENHWISKEEWETLTNWRKDKENRMGIYGSAEAIEALEKEINKDILEG